MAVADTEGEEVFVSGPLVPEGAEFNVREVQASIVGAMYAVPRTQQFGPDHRSNGRWPRSLSGPERPTQGQARRVHRLYGGRPEAVRRARD